MLNLRYIVLTYTDMDITICTVIVPLVRLVGIVILALLYCFRCGDNIDETLIIR